MCSNLDSEAVSYNIGYFLGNCEETKLFFSPQEVIHAIERRVSMR
jgi:hypothetical protein